MANGHASPFQRSVPAPVPALAKKNQLQGFTIARMTMPIISSVGTSLITR